MSKIFLCFCHCGNTEALLQESNVAKCDAVLLIGGGTYSYANKIRGDELLVTRTKLIVRVESLHQLSDSLYVVLVVSCWLHGYSATLRRTVPVL